MRTTDTPAPSRAWRDVGAPGASPEGDEAWYKGENVIDGETPYTDNMEQWEKDYIESLSNPNLSPEDRAAAEAYYQQLKAGSDASKEKT